MQAEVAAYVEQFIDQVDDNGRRLVVRNGYHQQRDVLTAAGAVAVKAPRVNDKRVDPDSGERQRFSSAILPAWARKSPQMTEVLPLLARCFGRVVNGVGGDPAHRCQVGPLAPRTARGHGSTQLSRQWSGAADAA